MKNTTSENVGKLDADILILPKAKTRHFPIIVSSLSFLFRGEGAGGGGVKFSFDFVQDKNLIWIYDTPR